MRKVIPFFLAAIAVLMMITYVPQVSLWLPHRLGGQ
jgi:TRAP-type C4-dicarboxylate transport system permease large subunit